MCNIHMYTCMNIHPPNVNGRHKFWLKPWKMFWERVIYVWFRPDYQNEFIRTAARLLPSAMLRNNTMSRMQTQFSVCGRDATKAQRRTVAVTRKILISTLINMPANKRNPLACLGEMYGSGRAETCRISCGNGKTFQSPLYGECEYNCAMSGCVVWLYMCRHPP